MSRAYTHTQYERKWIDSSSLSNLAGIPNAKCDVDPAPTKIVLYFLTILLPLILRIINGNLDSGRVPPWFKTAVMKHLLKKNGFDPSIGKNKNFRPISTFRFVSKLLETIVTDQLIHQMTAPDCLDKFRAACISAWFQHWDCTPILCVLKDVLTSVDTVNLSLFVLLDSSAVVHQLLLQRWLLEVGITDTTRQ